LVVEVARAIAAARVVINLLRAIREALHVGAPAGLNEALRRPRARRRAAPLARSALHRASTIATRAFIDQAHQRRESRSCRD
jgi:hypothetical protein